MYKLKYYSLNKEEKYKLKNNFYATQYGNELRARLNRLLIIGIMGILFSIYLFIFNTTKWDIVTGIILLLASFTFIIASFKIRINKLNDYLIKQSKKK